ncbi:MAG: ABC transporter substrate-binding protein [Alphaproteobacteria bacterium]|nr:ABC transporter substrate-binding protein [Alphaproteobacteria bacterium]
MFNKTLLACLMSLFLAAPASADTATPPKPEPIKIGEISEAKLWNIMAVNQRRGEQLAVDNINAQGGVLGRPLEIVQRDGGDGTPGDVLRDVQELVERQGIKILFGTAFDNNGLAVSSYAKKNGAFFLKAVNGTDRQIWQDGNDLSFRFDVSNYMYMYGKVFADAAAKLPAKRWAFVGLDYEFGHSVIADFQKELKRLRPDVEFVATQWHPFGKINAGAVVAALEYANPDAIFIANAGSDTIQLIREGTKRGLFAHRQVISVLTGQPEQLESFGKEAPVGWITQGYPYDQIDTPAHKTFLAKFRARFHTDPGWFSFVGYNAMISLADAINKAKSTEPHAIAAAMKGMTFDSLTGPLTYRASDNQSNLGLWVGKVGFKNGKPTLVDWTYEPEDKYYPGDAYVKTVRPQTVNK